LQGPDVDGAVSENEAQTSRHLRTLVKNLIAGSETMSSAALHAHGPLQMALQHAAGGTCHVHTDKQMLKLKPEQSPPNLGVFLQLGSWIAGALAKKLPVLEDPTHSSEQPALHVYNKMKAHVASCEMLWEGITDPETAMLSASAQQLFALPIQRMTVGVASINNVGALPTHTPVLRCW